MGRRRGRKARADAAIAQLGPTRDTSIADSIKRRIARYYLMKGRQSFFELGLCRGGRLRADVLVLAMNGHMVIVEVKSSVGDFRADKKMQEYEPYCHQAYVAIPEPAYLKVKDKILPDWGVFVMSEDGTAIRRVLKARNYDMDPETHKETLIRAAYRSAPTNTAKSK